MKKKIIYLKLMQKKSRESNNKTAMQNSRRKYKLIMLNGYIYFYKTSSIYLLLFNFSAALLFNIIEMFIIQQIINIS